MNNNLTGSRNLSNESHDAGSQSAASGQLGRESSSSAERLPTRPRNPALDLVALSEIQPEQVKWLWPGRIANGKLNIVLGDPGRRKVTDCAGHRGASDRREDYA